MKIKIALLVDEEGNWSAFGGSQFTKEQCIQEISFHAYLELMHKIYEVEVDVEIPRVETVKGKLEATDNKCRKLEAIDNNDWRRPSSIVIEPDQ